MTSTPSPPGGASVDREPTLVCISSATVPATTMALLRTACHRRGVCFRQVGADLDEPSTALHPGDMLYRAATSRRALVVERLLYRTDVVSFHSSIEGPFRRGAFSLGLFALDGLTTPAYVEGVTADRDELCDHVRQLGGLPVVVKVTGGSRGIGVMIADTMRGLFSLIDYLDSIGAAVTLMTYVERAVHWRVIVVGTRAVAAYANVCDEDDFRTHASPDRAHYLAEVPRPLARMAVRSAELLQLELGGVDILEVSGGRLYLLECNFPCYFATAQLVADIDIAGMMLDHLLIKRRAMRPGVRARLQEGLPVAVEHEDPPGEVSLIEADDRIGDALGAHPSRE